MIDRDKVILMTKLAAYEKREGRKYGNIPEYFRTDYITLQMLKSFLAGTIFFIAILGIIFFYKFETIMEEVYNANLIEIAKSIGTYYIVSVVIYIVFSYFFSLYRYKKARKSLKGYYINLKRLYKYYE